MKNNVASLHRGSNKSGMTLEGTDTGTSQRHVKEKRTGDGKQSQTA